MEHRGSTINTSPHVSYVFWGFTGLIPGGICLSVSLRTYCILKLIHPVFLFVVLPNGIVTQQNLTTLQVDRITRSSLTPTEQDEDEEEEGQVTPLPGSTVELDTLAWPPDEDTQGPVHVTVIPLEQVSVFLRTQDTSCKEKLHTALYEPEINCLRIASFSRNFTLSFFNQVMGNVNRENLLFGLGKKDKVCTRAKCLTRPDFIPVSVA